MTLLLPPGLDVGAATHTGRVRTNNEDDFLVWSPATGQDPQRGALFVVADGLGGMVGGAEASRTAVRGLATRFVAAQIGEPVELRMREAFDAASRAVAEVSRQQPQLRGMATTLTALHVSGDRFVLGHVGDSRCYRLRNGRLEVLTTDHVLQQGGHHLTRCIGAGREQENADIASDTLRPGDVYLLATDGLWNVLTAATIVQALQRNEPIAAAVELVRASHQAGGPDNCTAVVVGIRRRPADDPRRAVEIAPEEPRLGPERLQPGADLRTPRWPWLLLAVAIVLLAVSGAKEFLGFDVFAEWLRRAR